MNLVLDIPDELADRLGGAAAVGRRALEALVTEEYRAARLSGAEVMRLLGFATRDQLDGFLKARGLLLDYGLPELEQERAALDRLGL